MKKLTFAIALIAACASIHFAPSEAYAQGSQKGLLVDLRLGSSYAEDDSFDALADNDAIGLYQLGIGYDLTELVPGLRAFFIYEVNLPESESTRRFGGSALLDWRRHRFMALGDYGWEFFGFLRPAARLGAGYSLQTLDADLGNQPIMSDNAHDFVVQASAAAEAGWEVGKIAGIPLQLSLVGQFGYQFQTEAEFDELAFDEDAYSGSDPWDRQGLALGSVDTNGFFWDLGVGFRFGF